MQITKFMEMHGILYICVLLSLFAASDCLSVSSKVQAILDISGDENSTEGSVSEVVDADEAGADEGKLMTSLPLTNPNSRHYAYTRTRPSTL